MSMMLYKLVEKFKELGRGKVIKNAKNKRKTKNKELMN